MRYNKDTLYLITQVLEKKGWIELPAQGTSMYPFIRKGDVCRFVSCEASDIAKGDIILYCAQSGSLTAHRFCHLKQCSGQVRYIFKGDTNLGHDEAVDPNQILGKLAWVRKNKKIMDMTDFPAHVWSRTILLFPVFSKILRMYLNLKESARA